MASLPSETQQLAIRVAQEFVAVRDEMAALGSASTFAELTDAASADLPTVNTPLSSALAGKAATSHTHLSAAITDATSAPTANTLVLRDATGGAEFVGLTVTGGTTFGGASLIQFDAVEYYYGTGAASAHRFALNGGAATGDALFTAVDLTSVRSTIERRVFVKPTDTIKNADATLAADPYFQNIPVSVGVYRIYVELMGTTQSTSGLLSRLVHPANSRPASYIAAIAYGSNVVGLTIPGTGTTTTFGNMTANGMRATHGFIDYTFASSGTIAVEWAQNTSVAFNTTLHAGSYLIIEKLS